jgi:hypothetical protein
VLCRCINEKEVCMKKFFLAVLFLSIVLLPLTALADKVNTIDELVARYDSSQCAECHEDIHAGLTDCRMQKEETLKMCVSPVMPHRPEMHQMSLLRKSLICS